MAYLVGMVITQCLIAGLAPLADYVITEVCADAATLSAMLTELPADMAYRLPVLVIQYVTRHKGSDVCLKKHKHRTDVCVSHTNIEQIS